MKLVLSLFPGIGLLDMAFEQEGFCVVRGPDLLWGGDIRNFHPPTGKFNGVIGGPPCQAFSPLRNYTPHKTTAPNLIPEFERVVTEAEPTWWLMENLRGAPDPQIALYDSWSFVLNNRWLGEEQNRLRKFWFGSSNGRRIHIQLAALENSVKIPTVRGGGFLKRPDGKTTRSDSQWHFVECVKSQGLPNGFDIPPFKIREKLQALGNGVPLPMGRAIAKAVMGAIQK